jgi:HlyD family type I secretion membrane fusion protein
MSMANLPTPATSPEATFSPPAIPEPEEAQHVGLAPVITAGFVVIAIFIGGFGAWAGLAPLDSAAVASGRVVIESNRKTVKHLEGGIVGEILAREGDEVSAGQVLIRLDQTRARATLEQLRSAHWAANALAARLVAERDDTGSVTFPEWLLAESDGPRVGTMLASQVNVFEARKRAYSGQAAILLQQIGQSEEEIIGLEGEIASEVRQLNLLEEEIVAKETLLEKGLIEKPQVLALKRRQAQLNGSRSRNKASIARVRKSIGEARIRISELQTAQVNQAVAELQEVENRIFDLEERLRTAEDIHQRIEIPAPISGRVVGLKVHTPGGVIGPGEPLMDIVPSEERMLIDAQIDPVDVDVVAPGLLAHVRLTALNQRHLTPLKGRLLSVSADSLIEDQTGRAYYLGRVELLPDQEQDLEHVELYPGMQAEVMILTGSNTVLDYLAEPITRTLRRAFREDS